MKSNALKTVAEFLNGYVDWGFEYQDAEELISLIEDDITFTYKEKLKTAIEVIEYYANPEYWTATQGDDQDKSLGYIQGLKARKFLKSLEDEKWN